MTLETKKYHRREALRGVAATCACACANPFAAAAQTRAPREIWTDVWGHALAGYDCVSYFDAYGPRLGSSAYELYWRGAAWRFADMTSMETFARAADRYAPICGGYCVMTLAASGDLTGCDPLIFDMVDGRLALMSTAQMRDSWRADPNALTTAAETAYATRFGAGRA